MIVIEKWKDIKDYEGKYRVSNTWKVESLNYNNTGKPKLLKIKINRYGYPEVKLSKNNKTKNFLVSTLVLRAFYNKPKSSIIFNHKKFKNKSDIARAYGLKPKQLIKRLENGWTLEEAVLIPIDRKEKILNVKLYKYNDKLYSVKQLSELSGISEKNIYKRLARKWSIEEAVEIPIGKNYKWRLNVWR